MRLIRVFTDGALARGARVSIRGAAAEHVTRVLRLGAGDPVTLFNGDGIDYPCIISNLRRGSVEVDVTGRRPWHDGDWDIAAGQLFTVFRRDAHILTNFDDLNSTSILYSRI